MMPGSAMATEPVVPSQDERPRLSFGEKLWSLFVDPRKLFASLHGGHEWVILWLIAAAVSIGTYYPIKDIVKADRIASVEKQLDANQAITPENRAEILGSVEEQFNNPLYMLFVPLWQILVLVIVAGLLLFIGNIILGGNVRFLDMLNAYAWVGMIAIPAALVTIPLVMAKGSMDVSLGLGVLTSADTGPFLKKLLSSFELFGLWMVWLCAVAVSSLGKAPMGKAFTTVFAAWMIWVLAQSGLATLGMDFGM